jgi:hypothetical protein
MSLQDIPKSTTPATAPVRRRLLLAVLALAAAAGLFVLALWRPQGRQGFTTPAGCVEGYAAASKSGDVQRYLGCLAEPLRSHTRQQFPDPDRLAEALRRDMEGVKGWVVPSEPAVEWNTAQADVDVVRQDGVRRLHFRLERSAGGWLVAGVSSPQARPAVVPYGTHVKEVGDQPGAAHGGENEPAEDR